MFISCSPDFCWCHSFFHSIFCLTTGPEPPPKRFLHVMRSRVSSFKWQHPLLSLRSSSNFLRLLPGLLLTSISLFIFSSITCFSYRRKDKGRDGSWCHIITIHRSSNPMAEVNALASILVRYYFAPQYVLLINENEKEVYDISYRSLQSQGV